MPFFRDEKMTDASLERLYGSYIVSFESERRQVRADLFDYGGRLSAYLEWDEGYDESNVADPWISLIRDEALRRGYDGPIDLVVGAGPELPLRPMSLQL
jgi:hypothetical protein